MLPLVLYGFAAAQQGHFAPDPKLPWAVKMCELAYRERDIIGYPEPIYRSRRPASRYEYAVCLHAAVTNRLQRLGAFISKPGDDVERASLLRAEALLPLYRRADREFAKELKELGVEGDYGLARILPLTQKIAATSEPRHFLFKDMPADHWAAKAVGDLRAVGLVKGYPGLRFDGNGR